MRCVLLLASGAAWETAALEALDRASGTVVLKRCVDMDDLLASATTGQAEYAVLAAGTVGLDAAAVSHLGRHGLRPVVVVDATVDHSDASRHRLGGIGVTTIVAADDVRTLPEVLSRSPLPAAVQDAVAHPGEGVAALDTGNAAPGRTAAPGRVIAVWGPVGAPGRTTVAVALAGELARRRRPCVLVDADPHASVAQHLGVLDQVSGLLSAARVARSTDLVERVPSLCRGVRDDLAVLTGLPRPDRAIEVESAVLAEVVDACRTWGDVVVDCGSELSDDRAGTGAGLSTMCAADVLEVADVVVVTGAADPVGLARLARGLVDLRDHADQLPVHVVVNRMRSSLGWSRAEVLGMVDGFVETASVHVLPDDRAGVDRALVAGRPVTEDRGSALAQGVAPLLDAVHPASVVPREERRPGGPRAWLRQRRAGTTLRP